MLEIKAHRGGGLIPRGYSEFQVTGMIEWGQKSKPKKNPEPKFNLKKYSHAEFPSHKSFQKALNDITQELNTQKNPY